MDSFRFVMRRSRREVDRVDQRSAKSRLDVDGYYLLTVNAVDRKVVRTDRLGGFIQFLGPVPSQVNPK
jgi:hypothetical protein